MNLSILSESIPLTNYYDRGTYLLAGMKYYAGRHTRKGAAVSQGVGGERKGIQVHYNILKRQAARQQGWDGRTKE